MKDYSIAYWTSPIGNMKIIASKIGITNIEFCEKISSKTTESENPLLKMCIAQLSEYFSGERKSFDIRLDFTGTADFYQDVWKAVKLIPHGKTRSYSDIAKLIGHPKAQRAVGLANGKNPIPVIVPCHRVIGKNGNLTGYAYGIELKQKLLEMENPAKYAQPASLF